MKPALRLAAQVLPSFTNSRFAVGRNQRLHKSVVAMAIAAGLPLAGCNRESTAPSPIISIAIGPSADVLIVGMSTVFTATNNQTGEVVPATWSTSDARVASVSGGMVTGLSAGLTVVTASYRGSTASATVRIVPNYARSYDGAVFVVDCVDLRRGFCELNVIQEKRTGESESFNLLLTQSKDTVSGFMWLRCCRGPVTGKIDSLGNLTLEGTLLSPSGGVITTFDDWTSHLEQQGAQLFGNFTMRFTLAETSQPLGLAKTEIRGITRNP